MSTAISPVENTHSVTRSLRRLRRRLNFWFLVDGLSRLLACLVVVLAIDVACDWQFELDVAQRIGVLCIVTVAFGMIAYRFLIKPSFSKLSDDALCLQVEQHNKHLGESLISAMQLARATGPEIQYASPAMVAATVQQGVSASKEIRFEKILDQRRFFSNSILLAISASALIGAFALVLTNPLMRIWFQRNVLLQEQSWPNQVLFEFAGLRDGELQVPHGSSWPFVVRMIDDTTSMPLTMEVDVRQVGGARTENAERSDRDREFKVMLKHLTQPFEIRARSGRSRTEWHPVRPIHRPSSQGLELQISPPRYSGLSNQKLAAGEGPYFILRGSRVQVSGRANKPIGAAALVVANETHAMTLQAANSFHLHLEPKQVFASTYRIELEDIEQVWSSSLRSFAPLRSTDNLEFTLKYSPDVSPTVKASLEGVGGMVLPRARIPYRCSIEDDFGIIASQLRFEWRTDESESQMEHRTVAISMPTETNVPKKFSFDDAVDLTQFDLVPGMGFGFEVQADDNDDVTGPKTGKSTKFLLRVVSENELRENLLRREKELRQEFESVLKRQEDVLTDLESFQASIGDESDLSVDNRKILMECQHSEKLLAPSVISIASRLSSIIAETQNNRIEPEGGPIEQRLGTQIIVPMRQLGESRLPDISKQLDVVRRQMDEVPGRDALLSKVIDAQRKVIDTMKEILGFMIKSEGFQEAVNLLHQVQQEQRNVSDLTDRQKQERLERLLEKTKK